MRGSAIIKDVVPALVPDLSYNHLEIKEGGKASSIFLQMHQGNYTGNYAEGNKDLWEYCKFDTLAMARLLEPLNMHSILRVQQLQAIFKLDRLLFELS